MLGLPTSLEAAPPSWSQSCSPGAISLSSSCPFYAHALRSMPTISICLSPGPTSGCMHGTSCRRSIKASCVSFSLCIASRVGSSTRTGSGCACSMIGQCDGSINDHLSRVNNCFMIGLFFRSICRTIGPALIACERGEYALYRSSTGGF